MVVNSYVATEENTKQVKMVLVNVEIITVVKVHVWMRDCRSEIVKMKVDEDRKEH